MPLVRTTKIPRFVGITATDQGCTIVGDASSNE
jgi:hypothetical protein